MKEQSMALTWSRTNSSSSVSHSFTKRSLVTMSSIFCFLLPIDLQSFFLVDPQTRKCGIFWVGIPTPWLTVLCVLCLFPRLVDGEKRRRMEREKEEKEKERRKKETRKERKKRERKQKEGRKRVTRSQGPSHHSFHSWSIILPMYQQTVSNC